MKEGSDTIRTENEAYIHITFLYVLRRYFKARFAQLGIFYNFLHTQFISCLRNVINKKDGNGQKPSPPYYISFKSSYNI